MRASEVRAAHVATMSALTIDTQGGEGDRFVHLSQHPRDPETAPTGAFRLELVRQPERGDVTTEDLWIVEHRLTLYYPFSPDIDDRIGADAERVDVAFERQHESYADVQNTTCEPVGVDELQQLIASRFSIVTLFRQAAAVL